LKFRVRRGYVFFETNRVNHVVTKHEAGVELELAEGDVVGQDHKVERVYAPVDLRVDEEMFMRPETVAHAPAGPTADRDIAAPKRRRGQRGPNRIGVTR
jgi:hypothetical protein